MAKRSDFSQKLLDDLRLRKEKMGITSGRRSASTANDQWSVRGPKEAATYNSSSKNVVNADVAKIWLSTRHHKTSAFEGSSQDIIPVRKSHVDQSVDVSMALALALSNSGKLQNIEFFSKATFGKEHIMHRGLLNFRENNGRSMSGRSRHPTDQSSFFSHLEIDGVLKGVQQLNKILEACSNGLSFDKDAVDIGRELFKGAMDLEESLRMLVTLQEASDYMVGSKGHVRLLKGKEDESSHHEVDKKKVMSRPRFSFDEPKRNLHNTDNENIDTSMLDHNKWALAFLEKSKVSTSNSSKNSSKPSEKNISHKRSQSCDPGRTSDAKFYDVTTKNSNSKESVSFKKENDSFLAKENIKQKAIPAGEKVRIPNVVAKLMGLEELAQPTAEVRNCNAQRISVSKKVTESGKMPTTNAKDTNSELLKIPKIKKVREVGQTFATVEMMNSENSLYQMDNHKKALEQKGTTEPKLTSTLEGKIKEKNQNVKENTNSVIKHAPKPNNKQMDFTNKHQVSETRISREQGEQAREATNIKEQTCKGKLAQNSSDKSVPGHMQNCSASLPDTCRNDVVSKQELAPRKKDQALERKIKVREGLTIPSTQPNAAKDKLQKSQPEISRLKIKQRNHESPTWKAQHEVNKPNVKLESKGNQRFNEKKSSDDSGTQMVLSDSSTDVVSRKSSKCTTDMLRKGTFKIIDQEKQHTNNRTTYNEVNRNIADGNLRERRPLKTEKRIKKEKASPLLLEAAIKKPVKILSAQKVDKALVVDYKNQSNGNSEEDPRRTQTTAPHHQPVKEHNSFLQELEHRWKERTGKSEGNLVGSHEMNLEKHMQPESTMTIILCNSLTPDCRKVMLADQILAAKTNNYGITSSKAPSAQQPQEVSLKDDVKQYMVLKENLSEGPNDRMRQVESQVDEQVSLTKNEHLLKQILIGSQHFLNTVEALFKLEIPIGVLQASEKICPNESSRIVFDCGYEIMRRKGKREEINTGKRMLFAPAKVRCLDALVKELNDDIETLKHPSKIEGGDDDTAECLHKLLERDIHNTNPDANCMWDFGWNKTTFGDTERDEVIRDVEKHLLNGLIYELARDLLNLGTGTRTVV